MRFDCVQIGVGFGVETVQFVLDSVWIGWNLDFVCLSMFGEWSNPGGDKFNSFVLVLKIAIVQGNQKKLRVNVRVND